MTYIYKSPLEERDGDFKVTDGLITGATNANWDDAHAKRVDSWTFPLLYSSNVASISLTSSGIDHGGLAGLGDDDHAQYFADTSIGIRAKDYSTTGIITAGTLTDGVASLTGGVGTGYTLNSPVIARNWSWTGDDVVLDCTDGEKTVRIDPANGFTFEANNRSLLQFDTDDNAIKFGNTTDNPAYPFLGTGLASMGGPLTVAGVVKSESGRIKNTTRYTATANILVTDDQVFCNGTFTATLPAGVDGQTFRIVNSGTGTITIAPNGAELLTGENTSRTLSSKSVIILTYEPTEGWW